MSLAYHATEVHWRIALTLIPLARAIGLICRILPCRPATRHTLWVIALLSLLAPPILPELDYSRILNAVAQSAAAPDDPARATSAPGPLPHSSDVIETLQRPALTAVEMGAASRASDSPLMISAKAVEPDPTAPQPASLRSSATVPIPSPTIKAGTPSALGPSEPRPTQRMNEAAPSWAFSTRLENVVDQLQSALSSPHLSLPESNRYLNSDLPITAPTASVPERETPGPISHSEAASDPPPR